MVWVRSPDGNDPTRFCRHIFAEPRVGNISLTMFIFALIQFVLSIVILGWLRKQQSLARRGSKSSAARLVLPSYLAVLWSLAACNGLTGALMAALPIHLVNTGNLWYSSLAMGVSWGLYHVTLGALALYLAQRGAGRRAQHRAVGGGAVIGAATCASVFLFYYDGASAAGVAALCCWNLALCAFFAAYAFLPRTVLFRRSAMVPFARFFFCVRLLDLAGTALRHFVDAGFCLELFSQWILFGLFEPFVAYKCMLEDSQWWQGILSPALYDVQRPLFGTHLSQSAALEVAEVVDDFGRAGERVRILDFMQLQFEGSMANVLGVGGSARVYRGAYRGAPVAVKLIVCVDLNAEVVRNFQREASLLAGLAHPGVVSVLGVCIAPPALCLVMELCDDSLYDFLRRTVSAPAAANIAATGAVRARTALGRADAPATTTGAAAAAGTAAGAAFTLSLRQRLSLARQCVGAVSHLHARGILHCDVKSLNFLVTISGTEPPPTVAAPAVVPDTAAPSQPSSPRRHPGRVPGASASGSALSTSVPVPRAPRPKSLNLSPPRGDQRASLRLAFLGTDVPAQVPSAPVARGPYAAAAQARRLSATVRQPPQRSQDAAAAAAPASASAAASASASIASSASTRSLGGASTRLPSADSRSLSAASPALRAPPRQAATLQRSLRVQSHAPASGRTRTWGLLPRMRRSASKTSLRGTDGARPANAPPSPAVPRCALMPAPDAVVKIADFELSRRFDRAYERGGAAVSGVQRQLSTHRGSLNPLLAGQSEPRSATAAAESGAASDERATSRRQRRLRCCRRAEARGAVDAAAEGEAEGGAVDGTPNWAAPEVLRGRPYTRAADCYALGLVVWEVFSHRVPFSDVGGREEVAQAVLRGARPEIGSDVPSAVATLLRQAWDADPAVRPTAETMFRVLSQELDTVSASTHE